MKYCRIYQDINNQWCMIWYKEKEGNEDAISRFRSKKGKSKESLIKQAKKMKFNAYWNGYGNNLISL